MTPTPDTPTITAGNAGQPLLAERWLLASDDEPRLFALPAHLAHAAEQAPLLAWRLQQGLVQRLPLKALPDKLAEALASGASGVNIWADMDADALDTLVWQRVPVARQSQVTWQAWPAAAGDAGANADADANLLQALARPDAWAEVAWRLDGCEAPPAVMAGRGSNDDTAMQLATHAAAFAAWANDQWNGLDGEDLAEAQARDSVHVEPDLPMEAQPSAGEVAPTALLVVEPAQQVRAVPGRGRPSLLQGAGVRASAAQAGAAATQWSVLQTWDAKTYKVMLQGDGPENGPQTKLQVRVLLRPEVWSHRTGPQLWFVPEDDAPLILKLQPMRDDKGWLAGNTPLPADPEGAEALAAWLRQCQQVRLSAEQAPRG